MEKASLKNHVVDILMDLHIQSVAHLKCESMTKNPSQQELHAEEERACAHIENSVSSFLPTGGLIRS